jgi:aminoglycoside 2'-N-acetyltransferase I
VRADRRRHGVGAALMEPLERVIRNAYVLGALGSTDAGVPFYEARGWLPWRGPRSVLTPDGVSPRPDGTVLVLPGEASLDLDGELTCDWRDGDAW